MAKMQRRRLANVDHYCGLPKIAGNFRPIMAIRLKFADYSYHQHATLRWGHGCQRQSPMLPFSTKHTAHTAMGLTLSRFHEMFSSFITGKRDGLRCCCPDLMNL